jgi:serine/threonine protein kinase
MALIVREADLGPRKELGRGGFAVVSLLSQYQLPELPGRALVYKKYKDKIRPVSVFGLSQLVDLRHGWEPARRQQLDAAFNWPVRVVTDDGPGASGVLLPLLDPSYFVRMTDSYGGVHENPAEGQYLTATRDWCTQRGVPFPTLEQRYALCYSLVRAVGMLHKAEVVYGDLSHKNYLYRLTPKLSVTLVDCDSMRPRGQTSALGGLQPHTPDWEPPEALAAKRRNDGIGFAAQNYYTDRYKLGLAILRILAMDVPRAAEKRDPDLVRRHLPPHLFRLLQASLTAPPAQRPDARTWFEEMRR